MHKLYYFIVFLLFSSTYASAEGLDKCLNSSVYHEHRIEKEENVKFCFNKFKNLISRSECNRSIEKFPKLINTYRLKLFAQNICFYEAGSQINLKSCMKEAENFIGATEHDEALFYCYQIFQDTTSKKDCMAVAKKMKFAAKREYLENHCLKN